jgi:hypothetical protein
MDKETGTNRLFQEQYARELLEKCDGMVDNTRSMMDIALTDYRDGKVASDQSKVDLSPLQHETLHAILGSVNFMCICIRPDIAFAVSAINQRQTSPTHMHMKQLK